MEDIAAIYYEYSILSYPVDFPIPGNYTKEQFPDGVSTLVHDYKTNIQEYEINNEPIIIIAIGSGNINNKTNCELYAILYVPFSKVSDVLTTLYDDDDVEYIHSELVSMYDELHKNKLRFVVAVSIAYDYVCVFQTDL